MRKPGIDRNVIIEYFKLELSVIIQYFKLERKLQQKLCQIVRFSEYVRQWSSNASIPSILLPVCFSLESQKGL